MIVKNSATAKDGTKTYSSEMWMVEKIAGEWKLVAASMHFYKQPSLPDVEV